MRPVLIILPTSKLSGGSLEAYHVAQQIVSETETPVQVVTLFGARTETQVPCVEYTGTSKLTALFLLPLVFYRLMALINRSNPEYVICTHAVTWPLALTERGVIFVQALEWKFFKAKFVSKMAKSVLSWFLKRAVRVVAANSYLENELQNIGVPVHHNYNLWMNDSFYQQSIPDEDSRAFDVIAFLRPGSVKRLDRYMEAVQHLSRAGKRVAVLCWNDGIADQLDMAGVEKLTPMSQDGLKKLYANSRYILMLSEHEGFALPPLEAMASGCVPIATRCGGPETYINDGINGFLVSNELKNEELAYEIMQRVSIDNWKKMSFAAWDYINQRAQEKTRYFVPAIRPL